MKNRVSVSLECCRAVITVEFDNIEAPSLPQHRFRKNVICPNCSTLIILDHTLSQDGSSRTNQEVID